MKKSLWTIVLFAMLMMAIVSPFSALSLLMIFVLISGFVWTISTLVGTAAGDDAS